MFAKLHFLKPKSLLRKKKKQEHQTDWWSHLPTAQQTQVTSCCRRISPCSATSSSTKKRAAWNSSLARCECAEQKMGWCHLIFLIQQPSSNIFLDHHWHKPEPKRILHIIKPTIALIQLEDIPNPIINVGLAYKQWYFLHQVIYLPYFFVTK